ncbi:MAG: tetratricopeptide repeat protein [Chloroflexota bacterium]|nr:tetratricopeptide repeat protein [Chloroflexota bacterium]
MSVSDDLQRAYQLIKAGKKDEATKLLIPIVRADNDNADAWWLLANAVPKADQARNALKQFVKLRPDDERARNLIEQLEPAPIKPAATPASTTFDDDPFGVSAMPVGIYQDNPFGDEPPDEDVWDDPFAPLSDAPAGNDRSARASNDDPFANISFGSDSFDDDDVPVAPSPPMTNDESLFMPPERRPESGRSSRRTRSGSSDRPASSNDDLYFDDDPFDPAKDNLPPKPRSAARSGTSSGKNSNRTSSNAAKSSQSGARPSSAKSGGKAGAASARKARKPKDILIVDDFANDPFAAGADISAKQTQTGLERLLTIGLFVILLAGVGVLALVLINNNRNPVGSIAASLVATLPSDALATPASGVNVMGAGGELADLAQTLVANPNAAGALMSTVAADPARLGTLMAQATFIPGLSDMLTSIPLGELALTIAADPSRADDIVATAVNAVLGGQGVPLELLSAFLPSGVSPEALETQIAAGIGSSDGGVMPSDANLRGALEIGVTMRGTVDTFIDDQWSLSGRGGESISINLRSLGDELDPQLFLYGFDRRVIAQNDDIDRSGGDFNSRIEVTLPAEGTYFIIVSAFGQGGDYELVVRGE